DVEGGKAVGSFDEGYWQPHITFSPDGKRLLGKSYNDPMRVWDVATGEVLNRIEPPDRFQSNLAAFSPDGKAILVVCRSAGVVVLDGTTGKELRCFRTARDIAAIALSPDGKTVAFANGSGAIGQWDFATGKRLPASAEPLGDVSESLAFGDDGKH